MRWKRTILNSCWSKINQKFWISIKPIKIDFETSGFEYNSIHTPLTTRTLSTIRQHHLHFKRTHTNLAPTFQMVWSRKPKPIWLKHTLSSSTRANKINEIKTYLELFPIYSHHVRLKDATQEKKHRHEPGGLCRWHCNSKFDEWKDWDRYQSRVSMQVSIKSVNREKDNFVKNYVNKFVCKKNPLTW